MKVWYWSVILKTKFIVCLVGLLAKFIIDTMIRYWFLDTLTGIYYLRALLSVTLLLVNYLYYNVYHSFQSYLNIEWVDGKRKFLLHEDTHGVYNTHFGSHCIAFKSLTFTNSKGDSRINSEIWKNSGFTLYFCRNRYLFDYWIVICTISYIDLKIVLKIDLSLYVDW